MNIFRQPTKGTAEDWPIDSEYGATIHNQQVTVKRYAAGWRCTPLSYGPEYEEIRIGEHTLADITDRVSL